MHPIGKKCQSVARADSRSGSQTSDEKTLSLLKRLHRGRRPDVHTQPELPPLPPHITVEQVLQYTTSVLKQHPHAWRMIKQSAKQMDGRYLPAGGTPETL